MSERETDMPAVIELRGLGKRYALYQRPSDRVLDVCGLLWARPAARRRIGEFWALRDLDMTVRRGERVGIIGRNGAGKSTLLKIIAGTMGATEGRAEVRGAVQAMLELGTGFHPEFTGRENIRAALAYRGVTRDAVRGLEPEIIDFSELEEFIDRPIKTYSAGMYARLAFSVATAVDPELLIIDEVLGAGDAYFAGKCVERMRSVTERSGATVLFVSHDLSSVQHLCDRVVWLDRGRIVDEGEPMRVILAYQSVVRKEDEARLHARDRRILKRHAAGLGRDSDVFDRLLFRFVGDGGPAPKSPTVVYRVDLRVGEDEVGSIDVGGAMDNDATREHHLMDTPGYMDWGTPRKAARGRGRAVADFGGRFHHAPFTMGVARSYAVSGVTPTLVIDCDAGVDGLCVEVFDGADYRRIGTLPGGHRGEVELPFAWPGGSTDESPPPAEPVAVAAPERAAERGYGEGGAEITGVRFFDESGAETRILTAGRAARVEVGFRCDRTLTNPVFVFAAYLPDGRPATQWIVRADQMGSGEISGSGRVVFDLGVLGLGRGSYVASVAIFKRLRQDGLEPEGYHVLDRCIHFQVVQPVDAVYEWGLCVQPFRARLEAGDAGPGTA